ncbi:MAG: hypothetical protein KY476_06310 [Planctomycetes bacterium]|nr:hypothetical protein [Planctomycetota bacterium]
MLAVVVTETEGDRIGRLTLVLLRLADFKHWEVPLPTSPRSMAFSGEALFLTKEDSLWTMALPTDEKESPGKLTRIGEAKGEFAAFVDGRAVFRSAGTTITVDGDTVELEDQIAVAGKSAIVVKPSATQLWILTVDGTVLEMETAQLRPRVLRRLERGEILGSGVQQFGLWVLMRDGTLHIFGSEPGRFDIDLSRLRE